MGFLGVYKAIYDYAPQSDGELAITEGSLLYVLDKEGDDGWWKAKKKAAGEDEDEPEGLIPVNYIEEAEPTDHARALYEYTRQTDEELSFPEDARLAVYDTSDPDWILAGYENEFGFVPSNYIELGAGGDAGVPADKHKREQMSQLPLGDSSPVADGKPGLRLPPRPPSAEHGSPSTSSAAAALANVLVGRTAPEPESPNAAPALPSRPRYLSDASEDDVQSPPLPTRPQSHAQFDDEPSPPLPQRNSSTVHNTGHSGSRGGYGDDRDNGGDGQRTDVFSPGGFHMYNISEMVSVMGKRKKMPTTLGINLKTGEILIAPERVQDGPSQEWSADKMTHYSREGKHVFIELVRPSKSVDFHAGAKDTAEEIVSALGEMAGAVRAEGLREVILASTGHELKKAVVLYDFMAQGDDEVTVAAGDEVVVLDDKRSEEWCHVRRIKNGKEGVVPSSYVEVTGTISSSLPPTPTSATTATTSAPAISAASAAATAKNTVAQNRLNEERLTREAVRAAIKDEARRTSEQRNKQENGHADGGSNSRSSKSKPDPSKVRSWTDRTKSFSVEAQFLGLRDGKINLHKMNGVKIAVPVAKMSLEDLEYVERMTGISLDEDKPLSSLKKRSQQQTSHAESQNTSGTKVGASVEASKSSYDWFDFFLACEIAAGLCERYAQAFVKDNMDESVLPDIDTSNLRTLGLREGDIIKVMRFLDNKFGRTKKKTGGGDDEAGEGGLFSGPGGTLRNNTRRGRPAPTTQTSDVVDAQAFSQSKSEGNSTNGTNTASHPPPSAAGGGLAGTEPSGGFEDNAWDVKPSKQATQQGPPPQAQGTVDQPLTRTLPPPVALSGSMQELSLLSQPLPAEKLNPVIPAASTAPTAPSQMTPTVTGTLAPQLPIASPALFAGLAQQQTGVNSGAQQQLSYGRARPMPPQYTQNQGGGLLPPPLPRPLSAPQSAQPSAFGPPPLQPQVTGMASGQVAPAGQSLNDINQARMQQQQFTQQVQAASLMAQPTGMMPMMTGMPMQQQVGFGAPGQFMQPGMMNGGSQFATMQMQPTGFVGSFNTGHQPYGGGPGGGINSMLPPALEPQRTAIPGVLPAMQSQPTGVNFTQGFGNHGIAPPPVPQQAPAPLMAQKTGPPPPVRFGVSEETKKLTPQATGRRPNLYAATPDNPFGF